MTFSDSQSPQCATCGVERDDASGVCPICADERQYLPPDGVQRWTSLAQQHAGGARLELIELEPDLYGIVGHQVAGIGQQAKLLCTPQGNVLVDVPAYIDDDIVAAITTLGGITAIIATHPHMYGVQSVWAENFGATCYVSAADASWLGRRFRKLQLWSGELELLPGVRASQPGGHFPGSSVVHATGADGAGILLAGDTIATTADAGWVTFMRSYPIELPLSGAVVRRIAAHVARYDFDRLYSNFAGPPAAPAAAEVVQRSAERYAAWVSGDYDHLT